MAGGNISLRRWRQYPRLKEAMSFNVVDSDTINIYIEIEGITAVKLRTSAASSEAAEVRNFTI